ncbi:MAG: phosphoglycerate kinase [Candidatus Kapaibacterium sp.]
MVPKSLDQFNFSDKRVLIRVDFNVPLDQGLRITDTKRISESLKTINFILEAGGKVILMSHLGRPKGKVILEYSLKPIYEYLKDVLNTNVLFIDNCIGNKVVTIIDSMKKGDVLLLENLRFHKEEEENNIDFSKKLASLCDIYINDAFGTSHRAHSSTEGITHFVKEKGIGFLLQKELKYLGDTIKNPARPFIAILGGSKVSGKIDVILSLLKKCDSIIIGGGMIFTFFKAIGKNVGNSLIEIDKIDLAKEIIIKAKESNVNLYFPVDVIISDKFSNESLIQTVNVDNIPDGWMGLDIGEKSIKLFSDIILTAKTIIWNGPMGVFEMSNFEQGTKKISEALVESTNNGSLKIVGGGDSAAAITKFGFEHSVSHVSTGGGASLEFLEGKLLPGVLALD